VRGSEQRYLPPSGAGRPGRTPDAAGRADHSPAATRPTDRHGTSLATVHSSSESGARRWSRPRHFFPEGWRM